MSLFSFSPLCLPQRKRYQLRKLFSVWVCLRVTAAVVHSVEIRVALSEGEALLNEQNSMHYVRLATSEGGSTRGIIKIRQIEQRKADLK